MFTLPQTGSRPSPNLRGAWETEQLVGSPAIVQVRFQAELSHNRSIIPPQVGLVLRRGLIVFEIERPPLLRRAVRLRAHQLPAQSELFRRGRRRYLFRRSDLAAGHSATDRREGLGGRWTGAGILFTTRSRISCSICRGSIRHQLGVGAGGRREALPPGAGRRTVKPARVLSRRALLAPAAAAFVGLTGIYGAPVWPPLTDPRYRASRTGAAGESVSGIHRCGSRVGAFCSRGSIVFRLRLSPAPRGERQAILLGLSGHVGRTPESQ